MKKCINFFTIIIWLSLLGNVLAYTPPIGIPDPGKFWGEIHPIDTPVPTEPSPWDTNVPHWYYVNNSAPNASDDGNGNRAKPRKTIPSSLEPGDVVVIEGGPYRYNMTFKGLRGTASKPIWIVGGKNRPIIAIKSAADSSSYPDWDIYNCSYVIFDGFVFIGNSRHPSLQRVSSGVIYINENSDHLAFRHIEIKDYPEPAACNLGRAAISVQLSSSWTPGEVNQYHVFYDIKITDYQSNWPPSCENGAQGIALIDGVDHIWILNSYFSHIAEDGIHIIGLHGRHNISEKRGLNNGLPYHIYIGKNEFYALGENAIDVKESNHIIISQNKMHNFRHTLDYHWPSGGAAGNAIAINDEGYENAGGDESASNTWVIFNEIYDAVIGAFVQSGNPTYFVGNIIRDLVPSAYTTSSGILVNKVNSAEPNANIYVVNNTIYNVPYGIFIINAHDLYSANNIIAEVTDINNYHYRCINIRGTKSVKNELFFDKQKVRLNGLNCKDCIEGDPRFKNPLLGQLDIKPDSPAVDAGSESSVYSVFQNLYGLSISFDYTGTVRPQAKFDIGAFELSDVVELPEPAKPKIPENLKVIIE